MNIKQSRSTRLANELLQLLNDSTRNFDGVTATMKVDNQSHYECGYYLYERSNDRSINFCGHMNFDKFKICFDSQDKVIETDDILEARLLIIDYLFMGENNEKLNKVLR